jgi:hypothetical protein
VRGGFGAEGVVERDDDGKVEVGCVLGDGPLRTVLRVEADVGSFLYPEAGESVSKIVDEV